MDDFALENAKIVKLYYNNMFAVKFYIEEADTTSNLLVYSPMPRPETSENWLADTIRYSQLFFTDEVSIHLLNMGIDAGLRHVVYRYRPFFKSSERCKKFEGYGLAPYNENKIDVGVLSVLCKLNAPNLDNVVRALLLEMADGETTL